MGQLTFVVYCQDAEAAAEHGRRLQAGGQATVLATVTEGKSLDQALREHTPDGLFAVLGNDPAAVLDRLEELPCPRPLLVLSGRQDANQLVLRAMRMGAKEFLADTPGDADVQAALERLILEFRPAEAPTRRAPVIAVMGAKGGVGATLVACQLAARLQEMGHRTALVDLNLPLGDVSLHFDVQPGYTLAHLARDGDRVDVTSLRSILQSHSSGVEILAAPTRVEEAELVRGQHVERALGLLQSAFDCVVLDVSRSWNEASVRALDLADQILLVALLDVPTLSHAREHHDLLKRLGHPTSKIRLLANRCSKSDPVTLQDFAQFLGRTPDARIPNDYRSALASVNQGKTLGEVAPRTAIHAAFGKLAEDVRVWCQLQPPAEERPRGLVGRLGRVFQRGR